MLWKEREREGKKIRLIEFFEILTAFSASEREREEKNW